jgi:hypothetical protein
MMFREIDWKRLAPLAIPALAAFESPLIAVGCRSGYGTAIREPSRNSFPPLSAIE